jgi:hypothetical protein
MHTYHAPTGYRLADAFAHQQGYAGGPYTEDYVAHVAPKAHKSSSKYHQYANPMPTPYPHMQVPTYAPGPVPVPVPVPSDHFRVPKTAVWTVVVCALLGLLIAVLVLQANTSKTLAKLQGSLARGMA